MKKLGIVGWGFIFIIVAMIYLGISRAQDVGYLEVSKNATLGFSVLIIATLFYTFINKE